MCNDDFFCLDVDDSKNDSEIKNRRPFLHRSYYLVGRTKFSQRGRRERLWRGLLCWKRRGGPGGAGVAAGPDGRAARGAGSHQEVQEGAGRDGGGPLKKLTLLRDMSETYETINTKCNFLETT